MLTCTPPPAALMTPCTPMASGLLTQPVSVSCTASPGMSTPLIGATLSQHAHSPVVSPARNGGCTVNHKQSVSKDLGITAVQSVLLALFVVTLLIPGDKTEGGR